MTSRAQSITLIVHGVIVVAVLAVTGALAWQGKIGEQAVVGLLGIALGLAGGSVGTLAAVGFNQPPPSTVQVQANEPAAPVAP